MTGDPAAEHAHPGTRGYIALVPANCTVCMICAQECPTWCIHIAGHVDRPESSAEQRRPRAVNVLDRFAIDYSLCMYCGICVEACPFDALHWSADAEQPGASRSDLLHEQDRLSGS